MPYKTSQVCKELGNLAWHFQVEISCFQQPVNPIQPPRNLIEQWLRFGLAHPLQTVVGSSGGDYVMVIIFIGSRCPGRQRIDDGESATLTLNSRAS
ncbi:hypothetical protein E2562_012268 [Oryza meyeriana var. granulata]|uniref:Uncharacterized protein n=1 Tax=Oryza meyeriana var. granulata TaxID=110450 RepID=A0A6G1DH16_9ORYZ|nr:hypothetical protein E2562_012268 [Oryza meyeriana var. granulata]